MNIMIVWMLGLIMLPIFLIMMAVPFLTRKTESFGVSIPQDLYNHPELKKMRKQYVYGTGLISLFVVVAFLLSAGWFSSREEAIGAGFSGGLVAYIVATFLVYLIFHRKMKTWKADQNWPEERPQQVAVDLEFRQKKLIYSNGWFIIPFLISLATLALTFFFYERIPERMPMRYNFNGQVTDWTDKSFRSVLIMPATQMYLIALFIFTNTVIERAKQQISAENPEQSIKQNVTFRRRWSAYTICTGTGMVLLFSFIQLSFIFSINSFWLTIVPLLFTAVLVIATLILAFTTGQGGSRINTGTDKQGNIIDRDDDRFWKLGQIYFNPDDPAIFLEKRFGVGWTVNFARPMAWLILVLILVFAIGIPLMLEK